MKKTANVFIAQESVITNEEVLVNCQLKENNSDIQELVNESRTGESNAFDEIVRLYQVRAMQIAVRILGNKHEAAEAVQDGFIKAYTNIRNLRQPERFEAWFFRIITNTAISRLKTARYQANKGKIENFYYKKVQTPDENQINEELQKAIRQAMQKLSKKQARAIALFGIEDLSQDEVAEIMNCSVGAVRWHVNRAREKLKVLLKEYLE